MSIVSQIHAEAAKIADSMAFEILEKASKDLTHNRFMRLRKRKAWAVTPDEIAYISALNRYVYHKLMLNHLRKSIRGDGWRWESWPSKRVYHENQRDYWRSEMDKIESNLIRSAFPQR